MSTLTTPMAPRRHSRRIWILWSLFLLVVLAPLCLFGVYQIYNENRGEAALEIAFAETDSLDPGWRLEDMERRRAELPNEQNAAIIVMEAKALLPLNWSLTPALQEELAEVQPQHQLRPETNAQLERALKPIRPAADKARAALALSGGRYPVRWTPDIIGTLGPHLQEVREVGAILQYLAFLDIQERRLDEACQKAIVILAVGRSLGDEPFAISQLVRMALRGLAAATLERCLAQGQISETVLADAQKQFADEAAKPLLNQMVRGERATLSQLFTNLDSGAVAGSQLIALAGPNTAKEPFAATVFWFDAHTYKAQHAWFLQYMNQCQEAIRLPPADRIREFKRLQSEIKNAPGNMLRLIIPALASIAESDVRSTLNLELVVTGIGVERYRVKFGRWPETLDEVAKAKLLSKVPLDPYDGKPLRFRKTGDGVVLYSVGPDGKGTGNSLDGPNSTSDSRRYEFRLWNGSQRRQLALPKQ
jgi:hypothetical protein